MSMYDLLYPVIGILAGLLSGLFGIGAGIVVVPGLAIVFAFNHMPHEILMRMAAGTSFAIMMFTSTSSLMAHRRRGHFVPSIFFRLLPGLVLGVVGGALFMNTLPTNIVEIILSIFLLFVAAYMFFSVKPNPTHHLPKWPLLFLVSLLIGAKSGLLGIGGGTIIVPFLVYCNVAMRDASGISAASTLPIAFVGLLTFILLGWHNSVPYTIGYVYWPAVIGVAMASVVVAPFGTMLAGRVHTKWLKRIFAILLLGVSFHLLFR